MNAISVVGIDLAKSVFQIHAIDKHGDVMQLDSFGKQLPGSFILHATFEVQVVLGYTVFDITINSEKIKWAGQVASTFFMEINSSGFKQTAPAVQPCVDELTPIQPQSLQMFHNKCVLGYVQH